MRTLIIGAGEVGKAIYEVVKKHHKTFIKDIENLEVENVDVLQICYPDHAGFDITTKKYIYRYNPKITIINSSIRIGTTDSCGDHVVYSPVRGRHPKLVKDLKIYPKFVFGNDHKDRQLAKDYFEECGLETYVYSDPISGEFVKLISNVHMGLEIAWRQEVERMLKRFGVPVDVYDMWERTYANGYLRSDDVNLVRPIMSPKPIGGHCILPCTEILKKQYPSKILDFILESNENAKHNA